MNEVEGGQVEEVGNSVFRKPLIIQNEWAGIYKIMENVESNEPVHRRFRQLISKRNIFGGK